MRRLYIAFACLYLLLAFVSCGGLIGEGEPAYPYSRDEVWHVIDSTAQTEEGWMYADRYSEPIYTKQRDTLFWVSQYGIDDRADTLLSWLQDVEGDGLQRSSFDVDEIEEDLHAFRALKPDSCEQTEVCQLLGRLEYRLTRAFLRYAFGQRYGYTRPSRIYNSLLMDTTINEYRRIFDLRVDTPCDSFYHAAIGKLTDAETLGEFLAEIQPACDLYHTLQDEYARATTNGETRRARLCRINMERARWRYPRPADEGKYVWVNLASYQLLAVDNDSSTTLRMRVCCGNMMHKTPLLTSRIGLLEINPYWTIPSSIINHELATRHVNDSSYFARNRITAINKETQEEVNAARLSADQLRSGQYTLRQEKGEGNSLGRFIFRFPNNFSVYLHDTNSHGVFDKSDRAVSHGCVRVQKPLELAVFLMDEPDSLLIDKIRVAVDLEPLTEAGATYKEETEPDDYMHSYSFRPRIPVFIDYYTLYPDPDGTLRSFPDVYGYDEPLLKVLDQF